MSHQFTQEQVIKLAPDASSAKSGRELASGRKWVSFASNEAAIWGECQGSGKLPYQTQIDLAGPTFKCTCPSRKFPCKHGLGLLLMYAENAAVFKTEEPPVWVRRWLEGRQNRAETNAAKAAEPPKPVDEAAQAKRQAAREKKVKAGMEELSLWMRDLVRTGLSQLQGKGARAFEPVAARLVDAQAPGLARMVRELGEISFAGKDWAGEVLEGLGRIHLLLEGYKRLDTLSPEVQADVRSLVGFTEEQAALLGGSGIQDRWLMLGQRVEQEERLKVRRNWVWGERTGKAGLVLEFSVNNQPFTNTLVPGTAFEGELVFYPGNYPLRALVKTQGLVGPLMQMPGYADFAQGLNAFADALAKNPWLERFPFPLKRVVPLRSGEVWMLSDSQNQLLPLHPRFSPHFNLLAMEDWKLLALSGSHPIGLFGEWDGRYLWPLSAWNGQWMFVGGHG